MYFKVKVELISEGSMLTMHKILIIFFINILNLDFINLVFIFYFLFKYVYGNILYISKNYNMYYVIISLYYKSRNAGFIITFFIVLSSLTQRITLW